MNGVELNWGKGEYSIPRAYSIKAALCNSPTCNNLHLLLVGHDDQPLAQAVVSMSMLDEWRGVLETKKGK